MSPFNRAAWEGTKPLVEPMPATIQIGSVVWTKGSDDPEASDRQGGMVVAKKVNDDGELTVTVLDKSRASGRMRIVTVDLDASKLDLQIMEQPQPHRLHMVAREINEVLGAKRGYIAGFERWLLEVAGGLVVLADELVQERAAS